MFKSNNIDSDTITSYIQFFYLFSFLCNITFGMQIVYKKPLYVPGAVKFIHVSNMSTERLL